jgi:hypothetical protein
MIAVDSRWDSPLFRRYDVAEAVPHKSHDGTVGPGYPAAWSCCPACEGNGRLLVAGDAAENMRVLGLGEDVALFAARTVASLEASNPTPPCPPCFGAGSIKDLVRAIAGDRCIRCGHPYRKGQEQFWAEPAEPDTVAEVAALALFDSEPVDEPRVKRERPVHMSPCDERCAHGGPIYAAPVLDSELELRRGWTTADLVRGHDGDVFAPWRILTVHHADEDKLNCRWWNLLSLCQRCHLSVQGRVQLDRVWPHEHSAWFRPFVAGFYALRYEGREVTRAEAEERMDELLAYERQA